MDVNLQPGLVLYSQITPKLHLTSSQAKQLIIALQLDVNLVSLSQPAEEVDSQSGARALPESLYARNAFQLKLCVLSTPSS
jgi:hypothetical protein